MMEEELNLFERGREQPLAERLRPQDLDEFAGQKHLIGKDKILRRLIENAARRRQNDVGANHCKPHAGGVYQFFRGNERHQRNPCSHAAGR